MPTDAKGDPKDTIPDKQGQDSEEQTQRDSTPRTKVYTEEEVEKKFSEQRSALDKRIASLEKTTARANQAIKDAESRAEAAENALAAAERAKEEAEFEGVRSNPDALSTFQAKKAVKEAQAQLARDRAQLAREKADHADALTEIAEFKKTKAAAEIASKYKGVLASELIELTDGSPEKMEKMAQRLAGTKAAETKEGEKPPFEPDSGAGKGGAGRPSAEQLENIDKYAAWAKDRYK